MKIQRSVIAFIFVITIITGVTTGCFRSYPMFTSYRTDKGWYADVNGTQYVLWPDQNWILLDDGSGSEIGYLDTQRTSLYETLNDEDNNYLQVGEASADLLHVPLVKRELEAEFSLDRVNGIEWLGAGDTINELGKKVVEDEKAIKRFVALVEDLKDEDLQGEWVSAGCIYCYNEKLPGAVYVFDVEYYGGVLRCSGYNMQALYALIPIEKLIEIFGYKPDIAVLNS